MAKPQIPPMKILYLEIFQGLRSLPKKFYNGGYFEAARRWQNRSILFVCEDFDIKADAKITTLENFYGWVAAISLYPLSLAIFITWTTSSHSTVLSA